MRHHKEAGSQANQIESLILPVILLLTGLILIGGDRVGILSLDRIENLWPMALILTGLSEMLTSGDEQAEKSRAGARRV